MLAFDEFIATRNTLETAGILQARLQFRPAPE
jgi:hypothetical protein